MAEDKDKAGIEGLSDLYAGQKFIKEIFDSFMESGKGLYEFFDDLAKTNEDLKRKLTPLLSTLKQNALFAEKLTTNLVKAEKSVDGYTEAIIGSVKETKNFSNGLPAVIRGFQGIAASEKEVTNGLIKLNASLGNTTKAIGLEILAKKEELKQYEATAKGSKEYTDLQKKQLAVSVTLADKEQRLQVLRKLYMDYNKKSEEQKKKEIEQKKEELKLAKEEAERTEKAIKDLRELGDLNEEQVKILNNQMVALEGLAQQASILEMSLEDLSKTQEDLVVEINNTSSAVKTANKVLKQQEEEKAEIVLRTHVEIRDSLYETEKSSTSFSEALHGVVGSAATSSKNVKGFFNNLEYGFDTVTKNQKQRAVNLVTQSFSEFGKKKAEEKAKIPEGAGTFQKIMASIGSTFKALPTLFKGLMGAVGPLIKAIGSSAMGAVAAKLGAVVGKIGEVLTKIGDAMGFTAIFNGLETMIATIGELFESIVGNSASFQRSLGMSASYAAEMSGNLSAIEDFSVLGPDAIKQVEESFSALVEYTGSYSQNLNDAVYLSAKISRLTGINAQESAQFVTHMEKGLSKSAEQVEKMVMSLRIDAQGAGLDFKGIMSDVAKQGSRMALYGEQIATGIMKAAVRAKQLGGDIKGWISMTDSFADSFSEASDTAMSFNRIIGRDALSGYDLFSKAIEGDTEGIMNSFSDSLKSLDKEGFKRATSGRMGQLMMKTLKMDMDQYQKYVERLDVERVVSGKLKDIDKAVSGSSVTEKLFGANADNKTSIDKSYKIWEEGMRKANKDVGMELSKMQEEAAIDAAQEAKKMGVDPDKFIEGLRKGEKQFVNMWQSQMQKRLGFQSFDDMKDTLEKSMTPQERIEGMLKDLIKGFMPKIIQLLAIIARGIGLLVSVANAKAGAQIQQVAAGFGVAGNAMEKSLQTKNLKESLSGGDLKKLSEIYDVKLAGVENQTELRKQLEALLKRTKTEKEQDAVQEALASLDAIKKAEEDRQVNENVLRMTPENIAKVIEKPKQEFKQNAAKSIAIGIANPIAGTGMALKAGWDYFKGATEGMDVASGATKAHDIAFGKGKIKYAMDSQGRTYSFDDEDMFVASTNFNFNEGGVELNKPLAKGSLDVSTQLSTNKQTGSVQIQKKGNYSKEVEAMMSRASGSVGVTSDPDDIDKISGSEIGSVKTTVPAGFVSPLSSYRTKFQGSEPWGSKTYRGPGNADWSSYRDGGCGPTSVTNAINSVQGRNLDPDQIGDKYGPQGLRVSQGSTISKMASVYASEGIPNANYLSSVDREKMMKGFRSGYVFTGHVQKAGGGGGHFLNYMGMSEDMSRVLISDSARQSRQNFVQPFAKDSSGSKNTQGDGLAIPTRKGMPKFTGDFASKDVKYVVDDEGNVYQLGGMGAMASPNFKFDQNLNSSLGTPFANRGIYQNIPMPKSWIDDLSSFGMQAPEYLGLEFFDKMRQSATTPVVGDKIKEFSKKALTDIGYSDKDIGSVGFTPSALIDRLYNELFAGWDSDVKFDSKVDWSSFINGSIGKKSTEGATAGASGGWVDSVKAMIARHEGKRTKVYNDSEGYPTVGVGHLLSKAEKEMWPVGTDIGEEMVENLWKQDFDRHYGAIKSKFPKYDEMDAVRQAALVDMGFNLGSGFYKEWPMFTQQMQAKDFVGAANNVRGTKYFSQVGNRGKEIASMIESGKQNNELKSFSVADAYFGAGDVVGINTKDGYYTTNKKDSVAVGTALPDLKTNTTLKEGELSSYMNKSQGGQGSQGEQSEMMYAELISAIRALTRNNNKQAPVGGSNVGGVYIDGDAIGRVVEKNRRGHGNNLNGG